MLDNSKHLVRKFSFYHWVDSLEKLKLEWLPPHEAFYSKLKQECISDEDYEFCKRVELEEGIRPKCDFLVRCNNCDMKLFLKTQVEICKSEKIDMFKASVDLPGAAQCWLMVTSNKSGHVPGKSVWMDFLQDHTCSLREYLEDTIPIKNIHKS